MIAGAIDFGFDDRRLSVPDADADADADVDGDPMLVASLLSLADTS